MLRRKISIHTLGTRGDVQPYVGLAERLIEAGYDVLLAAPEQFEPLIRSHGIACSPLPGEFLELLNRPEGKKAVAEGSGFGAGFKLLKHIRPLMGGLFDAELRSARTFAPHLIIFHPKSLVSPFIAASLGVPSILASPIPMSSPTSAFASPMFPFETLGPFNGLSHHLAILAPERLFGKTIKQWQRANSIGVKRSCLRPARTMYAYSPEVIPKPPDWNSSITVTGFWFARAEAWSPPQELESFLDNGDAPIYFGFGSMPGLDPEGMTETIIGALRATGKRGILATGGGALKSATASDIYCIQSAPHEHLFSRVQATVHHGGIGTVAASLRAGKPMAICPFLGDQAFWARRVHTIHCGPPALDRKKLTVAMLANAIRQISSDEMRTHAEEFSKKIRGEDGLAKATSVIDALLSEVVHSS